MDIDRQNDDDQLQLSEESNSRKYELQNKQILSNDFFFYVKYSS
jgi:hypothetical protein